MVSRVCDPMRYAPGLNDRAVFVQSKRSGTWSTTIRLTVATLPASSKLGYAVAMDRAGTRVLVSSPNNGRLDISCRCQTVAGSLTGTRGRGNASHGYMGRAVW